MELISRFMFAFCFSCITLVTESQAADLEGIQAADLEFIRSEPFKKAKQRIDTTSIVTVHDARVINEAITPIMRLLMGLTFINLPAEVDRDILTEHGRRVLQQPPLRSAKNRLLIASIGKWRVCSNRLLSFSATYYDLFRKNPWTKSFIFEKNGDHWFFKDHGELNDDCK